MGGKFPLDLLTPVRHVATELDGAAPAALSVSELAATYKHPNTGDIGRVKSEFVGHISESAVNRWFVEQAIHELGTQVVSDGAEGFLLATEFDKIRYKRNKLTRLVDHDDSDTQRELRASMHADRTYHVEVIGGRGCKKERALRLHKLARALPTMTGKEFDSFVEDVRVHGVNKPILVLGDEVLDGRHRVAVADALRLPVHVEEFAGDEQQAVDRVLSENVHRPHLTMAQRGLLVRELYLPKAREEARKRHGTRTDLTSVPMGTEVEEGTASEIAAQRSMGLASKRTIDRMAPVDNAPLTKERIRNGQITSSRQARKEAIEETGQTDLPADVPLAKPFTAYDDLGRALGAIRRAAEAVEQDTGGRRIEPDKILARLGDIRGQVDRIESALG